MRSKKCKCGHVEGSHTSYGINDSQCLIPNCNCLEFRTYHQLGNQRSSSEPATRAAVKLVKQRNEISLNGFVTWPVSEDSQVRQSYDRLLAALEEQRRAHEAVELRLQEYIEVLDQCFERLLP